MNELISAILDIVQKIFGVDVGYIINVNFDSGKCTVKTMRNQTIDCELTIPNGYSDFDNKVAWGDFSFPTNGTFVLILYENGKPYLIQNFLGYKKINEIYDNGKLTVNRIPDAEDSSLTTETKIKQGEKFLRSIGFGDIFLDKLANILLDTEKEVMIRIGDRNASNIINSPDITMRVGRVKDSAGDLKLDANNKEIKVEIEHDTNNHLILNEDGDWTIENASASVEVKSDGTVVVNGGNIEVARNGDAIMVPFSKDDNPAWHTWFLAINGMIPGYPGVNGSAQMDGIIVEGNPNLLSD